MDRTEDVIRKLLEALPSRGYDIGILHASRMQRFEEITAHRLLSILPYLKFRNASGAHVYFRPTGQSAYTLLDDLCRGSLARMSEEGFAPAALIETSRGNFQAWLRHAQPLSLELGTIAAKMLADRFGADRSAADWRRFGRAPGFTNRKPQHRQRNGLFPFTRLLSSTGVVFPSASTFSAELLERSREEQRQSLIRRLERTSHRKPFEVTSVSLRGFRNASRYLNRPAAADMAFSICAVSRGWHLDDIAEALRDEYLSRDPDPARRNAYIQRTVVKARRWAA